MKEKMLKIKWLDHTAFSEIYEHREIKKLKPAEVTSLGFLVGEDDDTIKIVSEKGKLKKWKGYRGVAVILKSCILEKKELVEKL